MSKLLDFFNDCGTPYSIRSIIYDWSMEDWENKHDFIQWIFPTSTPSKYNPDAPVLTYNDVDSFYFFEHYKTTTILVNMFMGFIESRNVLSHFNHNWLRISRVLQSLRECGYNGTANKFFLFIQEQIKIRNIPEDMTIHWINANNTAPLL